MVHASGKVSKYLSETRVRNRDSHGQNASDPVEVFDEVQVDKNVFRFVVYILWLKSQSDAFAKAVYTYMFRSDLWEDCTFKVWML